MTVGYEYFKLHSSDADSKNELYAGVYRPRMNVLDIVKLDDCQFYFSIQHILFCVPIMHQKVSWPNGRASGSENGMNYRKNFLGVVGSNPAEIVLLSFVFLDGLTMIFICEYLMWWYFLCFKGWGGGAVGDVVVEGEGELFIT